MRKEIFKQRFNEQMHRVFQSLLAWLRNKGAKQLNAFLLQKYKLKLLGKIMDHIRKTHGKKGV